ncbi:MAG: asparagine synthetase B [bacterium TMED144]|nr:MAG: asparagine synthetase B [bacterium TMED144]
MKIKIIFPLLINFLLSQKIIIPMDVKQNDHLKAYGLAFWALNQNINVEWLLNYRGGSFLLDEFSEITEVARVRGVTYEIINSEEALNIFNEINLNNMEIVLLEKAPKIAIYSPPNKQPWDDAVTLALTYAEVPYDVLWDKEVFNEKLARYDWLHLHHEDFTGQYGKFYKNYRSASWYLEQKKQYEAISRDLGFDSVHKQKKALAQIIKNYIGNGGFLFAMCSATDSFDIALATQNTDAAHEFFDESPIDEDLQKRIDYNNTLAFYDFSIITNPMIYEYSDIDFPQSENINAKGAEADFFTLFDFSAKYDPVPAMLTQNHSRTIKGFMGQTTGFKRDIVKKHIVIMGEDVTSPQVKYIHGNYGKGTFTFLGGHDPEDYQHFVGDPQTDLSLYKNSPGYRLILNNILFPAAKKKERKT